MKTTIEIPAGLWIELQTEALLSEYGRSRPQPRNREMGFKEESDKPRKKKRKPHATL